MTKEPFTGVTVARIVRPWGHRGEVTAEIFTDFPERLTQLREAWLSDARTPPRAVAIRSCRLHLGRALFHFIGIDSINDAERLRGLEIQVPLSERPELDPARHYVTDLIGCEVWEEGATAPLGAVRDVQDNGASATAGTPRTWLIEVDTGQGELLIPLAAEICTRIDTDSKRIEVRLPAGLRDVNQT